MGKRLTRRNLRQHGKPKPGNLSSREYAETAEGQAEIEKAARVFTVIQDEWEAFAGTKVFDEITKRRILLKAREVTGYSVEELDEMDAAEFRLWVQAELANRSKGQWVRFRKQDLVQKMDSDLRTIKKYNRCRETDNNRYIEIHSEDLERNSPK